VDAGHLLKEELGSLKRVRLICNIGEKESTEVVETGVKEPPDERNERFSQDLSRVLQ
jgi:hypothetical protein